MQKYKIILCSESKRRAEILKGLDLDFQIRTIAGLRETVPSYLAVDKVAEYIAQTKASAYKTLIEDEQTLILTADTIVVLDEKIYGKPSNRNDAVDMLKALSGKTHSVITGVCLTTKQKQIVFSDISYVTFSRLSYEEILYYITKYQPYDKAGSYGIQEWLGFVGVEKIEGSFYNVMGLPIQKVYEALKKL